MSLGPPEMRLTHRRLTSSLAVMAVALVAATASTGSNAECEEGPVKTGGKWWIQYCGPATATAKLAGKAPVKFASGHCVTHRGVMLLYIGRRAFRGLDSKTKYWELVAEAKGDGVYRTGSRKEAFVEWWLGKKRYLLGNIKMTFKNKQRQATYTGTLLTGGKGKASGSFKC